MKKIYLSILLSSFIFSNKIRATHIVGGEFVLQAVPIGAGGTHILTMNLYFDAINGNAGAEDFNIMVGVFRKKDNANMAYYLMPQSNSEFVPFTNPICSNPQAIATRLIQYSTVINLLPDRYNDPDGYYIVWDRCCRNNVISNIVAPNAASMLFYLEFPPQKLENGTLFRNSSPVFGKLTGDYICKDRPFYFDFGATDPDGDSLVYSMTTPLNGYSSPSNPKPNQPLGSFNYPKVLWLNGHNADNAIKGTLPLGINPRTGQLTVIANQLGLYVFSVLVEEYRNGKRIGLVHRDFQLVVIDCLDENMKPETKAKLLNNTPYFQKNQVITFKANDDKKCVNFFTTDPNPTKKMTFQVNQLDGKAKVDYNFTINNSAEIKTNLDTVRSTICFNSCVSNDGKPISFEIIAKDDGCPQPLTDTIRIKVLTEVLPNNKPTIATDLPNSSASVSQGGSLIFKVSGKDIDNDNISIQAIGKGFSLASAGMSFSNPTGKGSISDNFTWTPPCGLVLKDQYEVTFVITDNSLCGNKNLQDSVKVVLKTNLLTGQKPKISTSLTVTKVEILLNGKQPQPIKFDVNSQDPDNDPIKLYLNGLNFDVSKYKIQFENKSGIGKLTSPFTWTPTCEDLGGQDQKVFQLRFTTEDNSCLPNNKDTVLVQLTLKTLVSSFDNLPPNVFTPNGDGKNDFFEMPKLPEDNCFEVFESIFIYNRWGSEVFNSTERTFKWTATDYPQGEYFYWIKFTKREFKGAVTLLR